ncbi:hypothetical protein EDB83DRAFT_2519363 [Lactarius deliciosus]|nr:hypothetical protein EDB83DRAFT_2519363 [Lactarius deliciosus]
MEIKYSRQVVITFTASGWNGRSPTTARSTVDSTAIPGAILLTCDTDRDSPPAFPPPSVLQVQTPIKPSFPTPSPGPPRPIHPGHRAAQASIALSTAGIHPPQGPPLTPLGHAQSPRPPPTPFACPQFPQFRNSRQYWWPTQGTAWWRARTTAHRLLPPTRSLLPRNRNKAIVNLPKETVPAGDGRLNVSHSPPHARAASAQNSHSHFASVSPQPHLQMFNNSPPPAINQPLPSLTASSAPLWHGHSLSMAAIPLIPMRSYVTFNSSIAFSSFGPGTSLAPDAIRSPDTRSDPGLPTDRRPDFIRGFGLDAPEEAPRSAFRFVLSRNVRPPTTATASTYIAYFPVTFGVRSYPRGPLGKFLNTDALEFRPNAFAFTLPPDVPKLPQSQSLSTPPPRSSPPPHATGREKRKRCSSLELRPWTQAEMSFIKFPQESPARKSPPPSPAQRRGHKSAPTTSSPSISYQISVASVAVIVE